MQIEDIAPMRETAKLFGSATRNKKSGELKCNLNDDLKKKIKMIKTKMNSDAISTHEYTKLAKKYLKILEPEIKKF